MPGYTIVLETEKEGGFVVSVPALAGCFTARSFRGSELRDNVLAFVPLNWQFISTSGG